MMRFAFLALAGLTIAWHDLAVAQASQRPNILFLFTDDHARHAMSCYGSKINQTPNLDRIANEGIRFDRCYVTNSICGPCRAVVLTGKYNHLNGYYRNGLTFDGSQQTFVKLLQKSGYQTAIVGKWHLQSDPTGFDYWNVLIGQGPYYNPPMIENGVRRNHVGYTTDLITDFALDWLKNQRDPNKPFLLMCQHKAPHRNWQPSPKHLHLYEDVEIPEPDDLFDDYSGRGRAAREQEMTIAKHLTRADLKLDPPTGLTPEQLEAWNRAYEPKNKAFEQANLKGDDLVRWKYQRYIKDYLRCVASVDENVGRLLDYLDESGLADDTIVVYSSDQGFYLGDHGWFDKRFIYEESLSAPLVVRYPGRIKPGSVCDEIVLNLDFAETILDYAGVEIPQDMQGESLRPFLEGEEPTNWRQTMYYHYYEHPGPHMVHRHYGVVSKDYKLVHFYRIGEWELYDLKKDPGEMRNVYDDPAYAQIVKDLRVELQRLQRQYQVGPDPEEPARARQDAPAKKAKKKAKKASPQ